MLDYHVILDLLPTLAGLYFSQRFPADCHLSAVQASILLAIGLQRKSVEDIEVSQSNLTFFLIGGSFLKKNVHLQNELKLPASQSLALFVKVIRKLSKHLEELRGSELASEIPSTATTSRPSLEPVARKLADELDEGARDFDTNLKRQEKHVADALQPEQ